MAPRGNVLAGAKRGANGHIKASTKASQFVHPLVPPLAARDLPSVLEAHALTRCKFSVTSSCGALQSLQLHLVSLLTATKQPTDFVDLTFDSENEDHVDASSLLAGFQSKPKPSIRDEPYSQSRPSNVSSPSRETSTHRSSKITKAISVGSRSSPSPSVNSCRKSSRNPALLAPPRNGFPKARLEELRQSEGPGQRSRSSSTASSDAEDLLRSFTKKSDKVNGWKTDLKKPSRNSPNVSLSQSSPKQTPKPSSQLLFGTDAVHLSDRKVTGTPTKPKDILNEALRSQGSSTRPSLQDVKPSSSRAFSRVDISQAFSSQMNSAKSSLQQAKSSSSSRASSQVDVARLARPSTPPKVTIPIRKSTATPQKPPPETPQKTNVSVVVINNAATPNRFGVNTPSQVDIQVPLHGLSEIYSTEIDEIRLKKLAQPKAKKVQRNEIKLDFGPLVALNADAYRSPIKPSAQVKRINNRSLLHLSGPPVQFGNDINNKRLDGRLEFVSENVIREGVKMQDKEFMYGCLCVDGCNPRTCECLLDSDDLDEITNEPIKIKPYIRIPTRDGEESLVVMNPEFMDLEEGSQIQECNELCKCGPDCWNRVVQKGRTLPLEIFMTKECGFGLRSPWPIEKGRFIDTYVGELVTTKEIVRRERIRERAFPSSHNKLSYVFSLDYFKDEIPKGSQIYHIDGVRFGGPTRFINHSCDPNCRIFTVMNQVADYRVYKLAFFAIRDIAPGEELCFDYHPHDDGMSDDEGEADQDLIRCHCGAKNCKKSLWPGSKRKGRGA